MESKKKLLIIHHSSVSRETQPSQFYAVNRYHKEKNWGTIAKPWYQTHPTKYGYYHGYTHFMGTNGVITRTRGREEEGLHTKGYNKDGHIALCIAGNFHIEVPNLAQQESLRRFREENIDYEIKLHKELGKTSCPGGLFNRSYVRNIPLTNRYKFTDNDREKNFNIELNLSLLDRLKELLLNMLKDLK